MPAYSREVAVPGKSAQELYDKISADIDRFLTKASIGKFDLGRDPASKKITIGSSMVNATLSCVDGKIKLDGKLSLLATPFKGKLDAGIDKWVARTFQA